MKLQRRVGNIILHIVLILLGITFLAPLAWVISTSLKLPGQVFITPIQWIPENPRWANYVEIFTYLPFQRFILNSFFLAIMESSGAIISSTIIAYGLSRIRWRGRDAVFTLVIATMMLPGVVTLIPVFVMFRQIDWVGTFYPLWVPAWFGNAFFIFLMRQYMTTIPYELDEAARIDGASHLRTLWQVVVPLCGPAIATIAIFSILGSYNSFMLPRIYISQTTMYTIQLGLELFRGRFGNFWHLVMAASMISILPPIILFFLAQKHFVQGVQLSGLAGR
ncbi:MAG: carbohydrate ABC transporter permease [Verrucomicrobia bacterium]|nr:carbohydrate ABC transporter permease [Verrucomicrobiota bacterium]